MERKRIITLSSIDDVVGVIFPASTGVVFSNQVGGCMCDRPELEGFYVPVSSWLPGDSSPFTNLYAQVNRAFVWGREMGEDEIVAVTREFLKQLRLDGDLEAVPLSQSRGGLAAEAWLPVRVRAGGRSSALRELVGVEGVLTWPNSD